MPGGWDGDALVERLEEAMERQQAAIEARSRQDESSPEQRAQNAKMESLRLSRARTLDQLSRATNPAHRATLERALQAIDAQLNE